MLNFKIATSFVIALLGAMIFARLASAEPMAPSNILPFLVASTFIIAGLWRARIYLAALRDVEKP